MTTRYQVLPPTAPVPAPDDMLEQLVRQGARKMLQDALEAEVDDFLGRRRYQRTEDKRLATQGARRANRLMHGAAAAAPAAPDVLERASNG